jgi:acetoin utilization protein AcuB
MLVQDVMQTKLVTVSPETTLPEAIQLTAQRGIRHLPVLDGERLSSRPVTCQTFS